MTELRLDGCTPTPLASYLKALGVLRLVSNPANNVNGEAADPTARGWWKGEHFHLHTRLDEDALLRFFLESYAPSPIITPWNGGSGFYFREGKTGERDPETGKMIKTGVRNASTEATRRVNDIFESKGLRLAQLCEAIKAARAVISEFGLDEAPDPKTGQKAAFIERYRSLAQDEAADWVDAAVVVTGAQFDPAALLGSGGNDGNSDFSTAFQAAVLNVIDPKTGAQSADAAAALHYALFLFAFIGARSSAISQFAPSQIKGANSGNGFSGSERGDPWSTILMFEGAIAFAGAATRRGAANRSRGSFPFTVGQTASGSGAVGGDDESSSRADEIWLPLWERPSLFSEVRTLLSEGRAHLGRAEARDGLTFARAVSSLGVSRGISEFTRLGFEARYGNMFITVPLGRFKTPKWPRNDLIRDLDAGGWLTGVRRTARETNAPARARAAIHRLEDALFDVTQQDQQRDGLRAALPALGGLVSWLSTSKKGREGVRQPPPRLSREWITCADDRSPEFRVAAALASLGWVQKAGEESRSTQDSAENSDLAAGPEDSVEPPSPSNETAEVPVVKERASLPMAVHFAPVDGRTIFRRYRRWDDNSSARIVWGVGSLVQNMIAVLERRLVEQVTLGHDDKPLAGVARVSLEDIAAFLEGPPAFDDARCAALVAGLIWARPAQLDPAENKGPILFAYAALKPLFTSDADLRTRPHPQQSRQVPVPSGLIARLRGGRVSAIDGAVREALGRAYASGIGSPFYQNSRNAARAINFGAAIKADRLAASLLIPINSTALDRVFERAYPSTEEKNAA